MESTRRATSCFIEVIVVDDCPDGSAFGVVQKYGARYVSKAGIERGQSFSRNIGIQMARAPWLCFLDDDDFLLDGGIDRLLQVARPGNSLVFGDYFAFNVGVRTEVSLQAITLNSLLVCNNIPMGAFLINKSFIIRNFDTRMRSHEDWDFLLSNGFGGTFEHVPMQVVAIDKTENLTTSTEARRRKYFWLDFLSIYARFPASHLADARQAMLASLGLQLPDGLLQMGDEI